MANARKTTPEDETTEPDGIRFHDELANTDAENHSSATSAPVKDGVPQGPGFTDATQEEEGGGVTRAPQRALDRRLSTSRSVRVAELG